MAAPQREGTASATASQAADSQHKRVYQACIPCRRRKVRCDLGSVDNPHDPPCVRCRRESKECFFSATRRKRKTDDGEGSDVDEYIIRNGRKRPRQGADGPTPPPPPPVERSSSYRETPLTPGGSHGRSQPLRRPNADRNGSVSRNVDGNPTEGETRTDPDGTEQLENFEAQSVMRAGMYGPHDALDLLYKAATDGQKPHERTASISTATPQTTANGGFRRWGPPHRDSHISASGAPIDPDLKQPDLTAQPGYAEAIKAWTRFRFVRAGWFTPQEAIEYIDYYYKYLSPMTPISPPTFSNPASHNTLLVEEPILTVTLLTIASRYHRLPGPGSQSRSNAIHEQLWTYLRGMIERCLWGQEAFGGGFCGSSTSFSEESLTSSTAPWRGLRKGSLRTLGTIESLLILTEWHPRALHFPPPEATDELVLPHDENSLLLVNDEDNKNASFGGKRIESWLEPAWRSDRMCWMLLSLAMGLGYELGVFDDIEEMLKDDAITRPEYQEEGYRQRAYRIKRLLVIYTSQMAGRLGWTSMAPERVRKSDPAVTRKRVPTNEENTPGTNPSSFSTAFVYIPDLELDDQIIHCWAGISHAMYIGNDKLFRSRNYTADIIQSGKYVDLLRDYCPLLQDWLREFERFRLPPFIRHILTIEYEYVRIYVNSLSLQAVVERCTNNAGNTAGGNGNGSPGSGGLQLSPQTLINFGKLPLGQLGGFTAQDQESVREVVEGSRNLLRTVVDGLLPGDYLKHAPVRTYFRIISGAMFLLKTFALGAPRADVKMSIELMDATVEGLRKCVVDDVHLGTRFADLLESLTSRLRNRFIQAPTLQGAGKSVSPAVEGTTNGAAGHQNGEWGAPPSTNREGLNGNYRGLTPTHEGNTISATPFDITSSTFTYPGGASLGPSTPSAALDPAIGGTSGLPPAPGGGMDATLFDDWNNPGNEMWYLPPGPAFFQNVDNSNVAMTAEGVNVGGLDLLEYMAMDPPQFNGLDGTGNGGGGF